MTTAIYRVDGMTCDHCVRAVTTELVMLPGIRSVDVDLGEGTVTVTSDAPMEQADIREAIDEAGYTLIEQ